MLTNLDFEIEVLCFLFMVIYFIKYKDKGESVKAAHNSGFFSNFDTEVVTGSSFLFPIFQICLNFIQSNNYAVGFHLHVTAP